MPLSNPFHISHKRQDFRVKFQNLKRVFFYFAYNFFSTTFLTVRIIQRHMFTNVHKSPYQIFVILVRINKVNSLDRFSENIGLSIFIDF
jgi:hypothetical protein